MGKEIWGIQLRIEHEGYSINGYNIDYVTEIGKRPVKKERGIYFVTNKKAQEIIKEHKLKEGDPLGEIHITEINPIQEDYRPLRDCQGLFEGIGIASRIELALLEDLIRRGLENHRISHNTQRGRRIYQLEKRFGKEYAEIEAHMPTVMEEFNALKKYVRRQAIKNQFKKMQSKAKLALKKMKNIKEKIMPKIFRK